MSRRTVRIDLGYDGRAFYGSQRQANVRTVQSELETAVEQVTGAFARLVFAGRTDRGVHAVGQVASGDVSWTGDLETLRYGLDSITGDDLVVYNVSDVAPEFHARFSARSREYRYRVFVDDFAPVVLRGKVWWVRSEIDITYVNQASRQLVGKQDFRSFAGRGVGSGGSQAATIRDLYLAEWRRLENYLERTGELIEFRISANAFLPHMVRNVVGALVEVGTGEREANAISDLLKLRNREEAPPPAPPDGLVLWNVTYDDRLYELEPGQEAGLEQE